MKYFKKEIIIPFFYNNLICFRSLYAHDMVISFSAGFSYSVLMWPRFAVHLSTGHLRESYSRCLRTCIVMTNKSVSKGFGDQVSLCQPINEREEGELINSMVDELNDKCGLELSHEFTLERPALTSEPENYDDPDTVYERVVMLRGSHSSRLTDELDDTCLQVMDISRRG